MDGWGLFDWLVLERRAFDARVFFLALRRRLRDLVLVLGVRIIGKPVASVEKL